MRMRMRLKYLAWPSIPSILAMRAAFSPIDLENSCQDVLQNQAIENVYKER